MSERDSYELSEQLFHEKTVIVISIITNKTTHKDLLSSNIFIALLFINCHKTHVAPLFLKHTLDNNWKIQAWSWVVLVNYSFFS
jgi:hypothetical protein